MVSFPATSITGQAGAARWRHGAGRGGAAQRGAGFPPLRRRGAGRRSAVAPSSVFPGATEQAGESGSPGKPKKEEGGGGRAGAGVAAAAPPVPIEGFCRVGAQRRQGGARGNQCSEYPKTEQFLLAAAQLHGTDNLISYH